MSPELFLEIRQSCLPEFSVGKKTRFYINAGPYIGGMAYSNASGRGYNSPTHSGDRWIIEGSASKYFRGGDVGLKSCMGLEIPVSATFAFQMEGQFSIGFWKIAHGNLGSYGGLINTMDVSCSLGLIYKLKKFSLSDIKLYKPSSSCCEHQ